MPHQSDHASTSATFERLGREFDAFYRKRITQVKSHQRKYENVHQSKEELTQAAYAWLWERLCTATESGERIYSIYSLFWKSAIPTQRRKTDRHLKKLWLLDQKAQIMSGSGSSRAPKNSRESERGVGQRIDNWQESPVEEHACVTELLTKLDETKRTLTEREQLVLVALVTGLPGPEAAETLGMSETNYRQVVFRLRKKLKVALEE